MKVKAHRHRRHNKSLQLHVYVTFCLLLVVTGFCSGCATTGHDDTSAQTVEDKEWEDKTTAQKIGYAMWWPLQWGLYFGGEELGGSSGK